MKLHTFGDSHAHAAWYRIKPEDTPFEEILTNEIGPYTMSRFGLAKTQILDISKSCIKSFPPPAHEYFFNVKRNDAVLFSFGEIDCRGHLLIP